VPRMAELPFEVLAQAPPSVARFDLLSDALECLVLRSWIPGRFELSAPWGIQTATHLGWFYVVVEHGCELELCGDETRHDLAAGDLIIVSPGREHCLRDRAGTLTAPIQHLLESRHFEQRAALTHGGGGALTRLFCGCFLLAGLEHSPLRTALPAVVHVPGQRRRAAPYVDHILNLLDLEAAEDEPGARVLMDRLVRILLRKAIRNCCVTPCAGHANWLKAVADREIGQALALMHAQPGMPWTVGLLAERVAMARSTFAARFAQLVGQPPLQYLTQWRIQKACALLRTTQAELKQVATEIGYESAAAFNKAFARWAGTSPGAYRRAEAKTEAPRQAMPPI
jgi:AraC-like DNA-binding protein